MVGEMGSVRLSGGWEHEKRAQRSRRKGSYQRSARTQTLFCFLVALLKVPFDMDQGHMWHWRPKHHGQIRNIESTNFTLPRLII